MSELAWLAIGLVAGWLLARSRQSAEEDRSGTTRRPTKPTRRQRVILATLAPDAERPTIEQLLAEELAETGADRIAGPGGIAPHVRLKVFRRDGPALEECEPDRLRFVVTAGIAPAEADESSVRLVCTEESDGTRSGGPASPM